MKKALLPVLIATLFASHGAFSAERELLFGPESAKPVRNAVPPPKAVAKASQKVARQTAKPAVSVADKNDAVSKVKPEVKPQELKKAVAEVAKPAMIPKAEKPVVLEANASSKAIAAEVKTPANLESKAPVKVAAASEAKTTTKPVAAVAAAAAVTAAVVAAKPTSAPVPAPATVAAPAQAAAPVVAALPVPAKVEPVTKAPEKAPDLKPFVMTSDADPFLERQRLAAQLGDGVAVGFFPSVTGNQDSFSFLKNYLPLANFLSARSGALISFVEERNLGIYRRNILENKYPLVFVNATVVGDAVKAGYVPLAMGAEDLGAGFVVLADSKYKTLNDFNGAQFAWSKNAQITMLAQFELANLNLADKNKYQDMGTSGRTAALTAISGGTADVGVMRSTEAKKAVADGNGKFRHIESSVVWPSSGVWIRQDLKDSDFAKKMMAAVLEVGPDATGPAKKASEGFARGFGVKGQFRSVRPGEIQEKSKILEVVAKAWPDFAPQGKINDARRKENLAMAVFSKTSVSSKQDVLSENVSMRAKYGESINVGLYPSTNSASDAYTFQSNFLPLSSYLSAQTGYSVGLIPETNANFFIKRIVDNSYPAIVIGPSMALAAISAGYLPVARAGDFVTPGFLVPVGSPIKTLADLASKRIGTSLASDGSTVGQWELLKRKVAQVKYEYYSGTAQSLSILNSGAVDAVLLRSTDAEKIVKDTSENGKPRYRVMVGTEEVPAVSAWVRHDLYDFDVMQKLADALSSLSGGEAIKAKAFEGIKRGYGTKEIWLTSGIEEHTTSIEMIEGLVAADRSFISNPVVDLRVVDKARTQPITYANPLAGKMISGKMAVVKSAN